MIEFDTDGGGMRVWRYAALMGLWIGLISLQPSCKTNQRKAEEASMLRIYYVPIGAQTLTAVTPENIEERGQQCVVSSQDDISAIKKVLSSGHSPASPAEVFTGTGVRAKLVEVTGKGSAMFAMVENEGFVKRADGHDLVLAPKELETLKGLIESKCK